LNDCFRFKGKPKTAFFMSKSDFKDIYSPDTKLSSDI